MNTDEMFHEFRLWCKANKPKLKAALASGNIRRSEVEDEMLTPALYTAGFEIESERYLAAFVVWGTGDIEVSIFSIKTGEYLVVDERLIEKPSEIHAVFDHYCEQIVNGGPFNRLPNI